MSVTRAGVLGKPITHSLSPVIHNAGYANTGLSGWHYTAHECVESELPGFVARLDPEWVGLSLTMPLKEAALIVADEVTPLALTVGAANTLLRRKSGGWLAENTDAPGMVDALRAAGVTTAEQVTVFGAGGTARAALAAAHELGAHTVRVYARRIEAVEELREVAGALGVELTGLAWATAESGIDIDGVVISTVPRGVADPLAETLRWHAGAVLFDVLYDPWPTPLATAAQRAGVPAIPGLDLLLAQAARQFELFTGVPAPVHEMGVALRAAAGDRPV